MKTGSLRSWVGAYALLCAGGCGSNRDYAALATGGTDSVTGGSAGSATTNTAGSGGASAGQGSGSGGLTSAMAGSGGSGAVAGTTSVGGNSSGAGGTSNGTGGNATGTGGDNSGTGGTGSGTGGTSSSTGGTSSGTGGTSSGTGGTSSGTGGAKSTGGTSSGTGGAKSTGGTSTGGAKSTGGASTGGTSTGGAKSTGGTSTGGLGTGGSSSTACTSNPCQNSGVCAVSGTTYTCTCAGGFTGATCGTPIFQAVPALAGTDGCLASGVSGDGTVVVGYCTVGNLSRAYRAQSGSVTELRPLSGGDSARALGVNRNGLTIVGTSKGSSGFSSAVRWAGDSPLNYQGLVQQDYSDRAVRTNADGSISVGVASRTNEYDTGVRWNGTSGTPTYLASGQGNDYSFATGINATGDIVVGYCSDDTAGFRWTAAAGYQALLGPGGVTETRAEGISDDGLVIAGSSAGNAVRWVQGAAQPESLGAPANPRSLSANGGVIVGKIGTAAFIWTSTRGMQTLSTVLSTLGATLTGWTLAEATDVSDDGSIVVGFGTLNGRQTGFRVTLPPGY